jgi:hypothetical protein
VYWATLDDLQSLQPIAREDRVDTAWFQGGTERFTQGHIVIGDQDGGAASGASVELCKESIHDISNHQQSKCRISGLCLSRQISLSLKYPLKQQKRPFGAPTVGKGGSVLGTLAASVLGPPPAREAGREALLADAGGCVAEVSATPILLEQERFCASLIRVAPIGFIR